MNRVSKFFAVFIFGFILAFFFVVNIDTPIRLVSEGGLTAEEFVAELNTEFPTNFSGKYSFVNMNSLVQRLLGRNTMNGIVKLKNGYLTTLMPYVDTTKQQIYTKNFSDKLAEEGIEFLYVQAPYLISKYDSQLPVGVEDYANENADSYIKGLENQGVNILDLRQVFYDRGLNHYDLFFKTDHHWKPEGAFYGFQEVVGRMEEILDIEVDKSLLDEDNYEKVFYEKWFMGSNAKRTGYFFAGVDDITLIFPDFSTEITVEIPSEGILRKGEFKESVLDYSNISEKDYFGKNPYHVYIGDEYPLVKMRNERAPIPKKILLIKDSFALPVQAFLSECFAETDAIDLRLYGEETVWEYVEKNRPDIVVVLYNPYMLLTESVYKFMEE